MISIVRAVICAAMLAFCLTQASAATITDQISISLDPSAFTINSGSPPVGPVTLSFDLTFDPTLTTSDTFSGFSSVTHNFALGSTIGYQVTSPTAPDLPSTLIVGGAALGVDKVGFGTDDFYLHITDIATTPTFQQFGLTKADGTYFYTPTDPISGASTATGVTFSITPLTTVPSVPLPAALPMFGAALLVLAAFGFSVRRRAESHA